MPTFLQPDPGAISAHLHLLFEWCDLSYKFEIRCLDPLRVKDQKPKPAKAKLFGCTDISSAATFAEQANQAGYNCYVTVNPLGADTTTSATDKNTVEALWQVIDVDGTDDLDSLLNSCAFPPAMMVMTGAVPAQRVHVYWLMNRSVDPTQWTVTQRGLAHHFQSDATIHNPSRILRLAGTVSIPSLNKSSEGYVTELVDLVMLSGDSVDQQKFATTYPLPAKPAPKLAGPNLDKNERDDVPVDVIAHALAVIPAINQKGHRSEWLSIANATKAANPYAKFTFDQWQRQSTRYQNSDEDIWDALDPELGDFALLFKLARSNDPEWWRTDPNVAIWCRRYWHNTFGDKEEVKPEPEDPAAEPDEPQAEQEPKHSKFYPHHYSDLAQRPVSKWLLKDLIMERHIGVVQGPPGSYKSYFMLDLCSRLAHGLFWHGKRLTPRNVVWVAGEGADDFAKRRNAWFIHNGIMPADDGLRMVESAVRLLDPAELQGFIKELKRHVSDIALVVLDTLNTCLAGHKQNEDATMTGAIDAAKTIQKELGCAVIIIHHPGKDVERGARGSSTLTADVHTEWKVTKTGNGCHVRTTKQKEGPDQKEFCWATTSVMTEFADEDGESIWSLVLSPSATQPDSPALPKEAYVLDTSGEDADRNIIVSYLQIGQRVSIAGLAKSVMATIRRSQRSTDTRIWQVISIEWQPGRMPNGTPVRVRRVSEQKGKMTYHFVEMDTLIDMQT